jgi:hypothetical protein
VIFNSYDWRSCEVCDGTSRTPARRDLLTSAIRGAASRNARSPGLDSLAAFIRSEWPWLTVMLEPWESSTDRHIPGTRLRHPGLGRKGRRLLVKDRDETFLDHRSSETYRRNSEVCRWIVDRLDNKETKPCNSTK